MKRVLAILMLAAVLATHGGCSTAPEQHRDQGYGSASGRPSDADRFEREKATSSATSF